MKTTQKLGHNSLCISKNFGDNLISTVLKNTANIKKHLELCIVFSFLFCLVSQEVLRQKMSQSACRGGIEYSSINFYVDFLMSEFFVLFL